MTHDQIRELIIQGRNTELRHALRRGEDPNQSVGGETLLMCAADNDNAEAIQILHDHGANLEAKDHNKQSALAHAALTSSPKATKQLLKCGANSRSILNGHSLLWYAVVVGSVEVCSVFIEAGLPMYHRKSENCPYWYAVRLGRDKVLDLFLSAGADVDKRNEKQETPLIYLAGADNEIACRLFIDHGANWKFRDNDGRAARHIAGPRASAAFEPIRRNIQTRWDQRRLKHIASKVRGQVNEPKASAKLGRM